MTVEKAAEVLGISRGSAYQAAKRGQIPTIQVGRRLLVPVAPLRRMVGENPDIAEAVSRNGSGS